MTVTPRAAARVRDLVSPTVGRIRCRWPAGWTLTLAMLLGAVTANAQVDVTASAGTGAASYTTLDAAFDAINAGTHQGVITIGISGNTTEPAPGADLARSGFGAASYASILIKPTGGAARTISGAPGSGNPLILLVGADNVTIDGLNTGGNSLTITNTTVASSQTSTIRFISGASSNVITNATILGSSTADALGPGGTIYFSNDGVTSGNDNNTISNCNIGPAGANLPSKAIYCAGTSGAANSGNVINNNNIFDYFAAAVSSAGIVSSGNGCAGETITNNRFYQTAARTWTTGSRHTPILLDGSPGGATITGNIIGFASNTQTGTYTLNGAGALAKFIGIYVDGGTTPAPMTVNNNTIAAVSMTGVSGSGQTNLSPFTAILLQDGGFTSNGNVIGSQSATNSLVFSTTTTSSTDVHGILSFGANAWTSNNNTVGGISVTNLAASGFFLLTGMRASTSTAATWSATGNTVGGSVADSIRLNSTGNGSEIYGLLASTAAATLTSNVIRNLTHSGSGASSNGALTGIQVSSSTASLTVSQNTISSLSDSNASALSAVVQGINISGPAGSVVARNRIHGLTVATNSGFASVVGIRATFSTAIIRNNLVAIGAGIANALGAAATNAGETGISGIHDAAGGSSSNSFLHNSVYIGGSPTAGSGASYAFNGVQASGSRIFRDNIFVNARSNSGATGKHYAVKINGTAPNPAGLTINNNVYFTSGTGGVFGFFNSLDVANLAAWQAAVGQDAASLSGNPQYNDPTNATPDLHLHPTLFTPAEGAGADVGVTDDFDGQTRASLTPVDIGADAGNFTGPQTDLWIIKSDGVSTATPGGSVSYTIGAINLGPTGVVGATVADTFTGSLTCSWTCAGTSGGTCAASGSGNISDTVNLPVGGSVSYTAACNISAGATGTLSNTATVATPAGITDSAPSNNSATDSDTLAPQANLAITKTDGQTLVNPGQLLTYTIAASNVGPSSATGATVSDTFPASLTGCSWTCAGGGGGTCPASGSGNIAHLVNLPAGGTATFTASCTVVNGAIGSVTNTATIAPPGGTTDPNGANNAATDFDGLPIVFVSDFEEGNLSEWSSTQPFTLARGRSLALDSLTEARFAYDFSTLISVPELQASPLATVLDATGSATVVIEARMDLGGRIELRLVGTGEGRPAVSAWSEVAPVKQSVRLEWRAGRSALDGRVGVYLDGRLALWLDGLALGTPAGLVLGRLLP